MEFLTIFGKVVAKNRAFGNNIIFLQQFFSISGGGHALMALPTGGAYVVCINPLIFMQRCPGLWKLPKCENVLLFMAKFYM